MGQRLIARGKIESVQHVGERVDVFTVPNVIAGPNLLIMYGLCLFISMLSAWAY